MALCVLLLLCADWIPSSLYHRSKSFLLRGSSLIPDVTREISALKSIRRRLNFFFSLLSAAHGAHLGWRENIFYYFVGFYLWLLEFEMRRGAQKKKILFFLNVRNNMSLVCAPQRCIYTKKSWTKKKKRNYRVELGQFKRPNKLIKNALNWNERAERIRLDESNR